MKKNLFIVFLVGVCVSIFTGCSNGSKYTEEEENVISDYMAQMVFKHCEGFDYKLVNVSDNPFIREEEDIEKSEEADKDTESDEKVKTGAVEEDKTSDEKENVDLANVLDLSNDINAEVKKFTFYSEYTEDAYIIEAEDGKMLLKIDFKLINNANKKIKVNNNSDAKFSVKLEGKEYKSLMTALKNDLLFFSKTIGAKKSESATLIFSVPKSAKKDKIELEVSSKKGVTLIQLE